MLLQKFLIRRYQSFTVSVFKVFDNLFCRNEYQITMIKLLKGQFLQKQFIKELMFMS